MVNGILNVNKEKGYTSHDVVAKLRGIIGQRKIGHTGTLDPDATGVLPVCLGKATKLCDLLTDKNKEYEATLLLGVETDTQDTTGTVMCKAETKDITEAQVRECVAEFIGKYNQIPPMYSALKVEGKKLYELAREGKTIERKAREVHIYVAEILSIDLPRVYLKVKCSKGTYIRTLCHDIGRKLQCGGCMEELVRTRVGTFELQNAMKLDEIEKCKHLGGIEDELMPVDEIFKEYKQIHLHGENMKRVYNGNPFSSAKVQCQDGEIIRIYNEQAEFVALYRYEENKNNFKAWKMFL